MNAQELKDLATDWIACEGSYSPAWERVCDLVINNPDDAWKVIQEIVSREISDATTSNLAAGPLEDLLAKHGTKFVDHMEISAKSDTKFARLLGGVWGSRLAPDVWQKVQALRQGVW